MFGKYTCRQCGCKVSVNYKPEHDAHHRIIELIVKNIETLTSLAKDIPFLVTRDEITALLKALSPLKP